MSATVLLPLYIFPSVGAWDPFFKMASLHPRVQFTAIVNPNSGPGKSPLPDELYSHAIKRLNVFDNVRTVSYVATTWCAKNLSSVLDEVAAYSRWGDHDPSLAMKEIFFDETPTHYNTEYVSYLRDIS
ncbi:hypothetical protein K458DRAFT_164899 [Lentithecium fluviatile CBS 122367]|uniref:Uncharacterized protein n=1 Tax=Lentithecium fluviatile CBS 122367 TaxID=1168545 RepID=A0A6G1IGE8_9PLEO|nr:hypothetical protein K458DRAFT_164899 [Lentithecium fluviatile CBS 122367]